MQIRMKRIYYQTIIYFQVFVIKSIFYFDGVLLRHFSYLFPFSRLSSLHFINLNHQINYSHYLYLVTILTITKYSWNTTIFWNVRWIWSSSSEIIVTITIYLFSMSLSIRETDVSLTNRKQYHIDFQRINLFDVMVWLLRVTRMLQELRVDGYAFVTKHKYFSNEFINKSRHSKIVIYCIYLINQALCGSCLPVIF